MKTVGKIYKDNPVIKKGGGNIFAILGGVCTILYIKSEVKEFLSIKDIEVSNESFDEAKQILRKNGKYKYGDVRKLAERIQESKNEAIKLEDFIKEIKDDKGKD